MQIVILVTTPVFGDTAQVGQAERNFSAQPIAFIQPPLIDMTDAPLRAGGR